VTKFNKGDLVRYLLLRGTQTFPTNTRGIVLGESRCGEGYRVRWLGGGVGVHGQDNLVKIEVEGD